MRKQKLYKKESYIPTYHLVDFDGTVERTYLHMFLVVALI